MASISVELLWGEDLGGASRLVVPVGGRGILVARQAQGPGILWIDLLSPDQEIVAKNQLSLSELSSTIGVLSLEMAPRPETRGCPRCSDPEQLIDLPSLTGCAVFISGYSHPLTGSDQALHVVMRSTTPTQVRDRVFEMAGGSRGLESLDTTNGLVWMPVRVVGRTDLLDMALFLGERPEVVAIDLYGEGESGQFFLPLRQ